MTTGKMKIRSIAMGIDEVNCNASLKLSVNPNSTIDKKKTVTNS